MAFPDKMQITVKKDEGKVRFSIKLNDDAVVVVESTIAEFDQLVAQYEAAKQG